MAICTKCNRELDDANFNSRGNGERHKQCKFCKTSKIKEFYKNNRQFCIDRAKATRAAARKKISKMMIEAKSVPCKDCGKNFPYYAMDFDHMPGHKKEYNIAEFRRSPSFKRFKAEVAKCEVVCAVCHRIRTYNRKPKFNLE